MKDKGETQDTGVVTDLVCEGGVEGLHAAPAAHTADGAAQGAQHRAVGHPQAGGNLVLAQAETGVLAEKPFKYHHLLPSCKLFVCFSQFLNTFRTM